MLKNHKSIEIFDYWWAYLIAICIAGLVIRLYFLPFDIPPVVDAGDYFGYALEIKNSEGIRRLILIIRTQPCPLVFGGPCDL